MDLEEVGGKKSESEIGEERNGRFVQNCLQMEAGLGCFLPRGKHKVQSWLWLFGWLALPRIIILSKVESVKISTLVENPDLQKGWGGCGEGHPRGGDQAGKDLCRLHGGQPGQHPKIGHVTKCDDQELATMINKGKGKLKWERDMPLVAVLCQTEFFSGFRQRPWWACCRRNTWFRSRRWSTTARSSWTSTTSWAKWRSFRREPFLHLSIKQQSVHISYRVQSDLDRRESLQRLTSTDIFRLELQNLFIAKCFLSFTFCTFIWFQRINKY